MMSISRTVPRLGKVSKTKQQKKLQQLQSREERARSPGNFEGIKGMMNEHVAAKVVKDKMKKLSMASLMASRCDVYVLGGNLGLGLWNGDAVLHNLDTIKAPQPANGVVGLAKVLSMLDAMRASTEPVIFTDAALIKLAIRHLTPVAEGETNIEKAMAKIAKTIDCASADEWDAGVEYRKKLEAEYETQKRKKKKLRVASRNRISSDEAASKYTTRVDLKESKLGKENSEERLNKTPSIPRRSTVEIRSELNKIMGTCVTETKTTQDAYTVIGSLGHPTTTYKCTCCASKKMVLVDLLTHCSTQNHIAKYAEKYEGQQDAFIHAMRMHQSFSWMTCE